jgi:hypothetical protein
MSSTVTNTLRSRSDRFEPELDPSEQRKLRGHLDQIDYAAYAANRTVLGHALGRIDVHAFERLAVAAAQARASWVAAAVHLAEGPAALTPAQVAELAALRQMFEEMTEAYDAMRRLVERGYVAYGPRT